MLRVYLRVLEKFMKKNLNIVKIQIVIKEYLIKKDIMIFVVNLVQLHIIIQIERVVNIH